MRYGMVDLPDGTPNTEHTFTKYLEGTNMRLLPA